MIGIIVSIGLLSLGVLGDDRQLRIEARRISSLIEVAQDEAVMQGREFGLEFMIGGYRFVEYDPFEERWVEIIGDDVFRARQLPDGVEFDLILEDKIVLLKTDAQKIAAPDDDDPRKADESFAPHLLIFSSGESTPFELHIANRDKQQLVILQGDLLGSIETMTESEKADAML